MRAIVAVLALWAAPALWAQQGWVPLGTLVDAPATEAMHRWRNAGHSAVRPYAYDEVARYLRPDSVSGPAKGIARFSAPDRKWAFGPLLDAEAGAALGERAPFRYRAGGGAWVTWRPAPRWALHVDGRLLHATLPHYLDTANSLYATGLGEGWQERSGNTLRTVDASAYIDYKAGAYFHLTLGHGKHFFGEGHRSLFLSDEAAAYPYFKITTTAWKIKYVNLFAVMDHSWPVNSTRGSGTARKFTSMHYLSWNATPRINLGVFEAIVWEDNDPAYPRGLDLAYLNPVVLYRPIEFGIGSPDNALMGFAVNVKVGRRSLAYGQLMFDEFLMSNIRAGNGWYGNKQGFQLGYVAHGAFRLPALTLRTEFNYVRPFMYGHYDPRQSYTHGGQPLAHSYGSGFQELLLMGRWRSGNMVLEATLGATKLGMDTLLGPGGSRGNDILLGDTERSVAPSGAYYNYGYRMQGAVPATLYHAELSAHRILDPNSGLALFAVATLRWQRAPGLDHDTYYLRAGIRTGLRDRQAMQMRTRVAH